MGINKLKAGLFIIFTLFFVPVETVKGAMPKDPIAKWQLIRDDFYIDTNDFEIENEKINFWVKKGNYEKTRMIIDCQNLRYRETFLVSVGLLKRNEWNTILNDTSQYSIANQLCFLSNVMGFKPERNFKQTNWAKRIIFIYEKNKIEMKELEEKIKSNKNKIEKEIIFIEE